MNDVFEWDFTTFNIYTYKVFLEVKKCPKEKALQPAIKLNICFWHLRVSSVYFDKLPRNGGDAPTAVTALPIMSYRWRLNTQNILLFCKYPVISSGTFLTIKFFIFNNLCEKHFWLTLTFWRFYIYICTWKKCSLI